MSTLVEHNLAALLFLPWFLILGTVFCLVPRQPRDAARRWFDAGALVLSTLAFLVSIHASRLAADPAQGHVWQQIIATAVGYIVFLTALTVAVIVRARWIRQRRDRAERRAGRRGDLSA